MARVSHKSFHALVSAAAIACGLLLANSAEAKYTAIDVGGNNDQLIFYFGGYCDRTSPADPGGECGSTYTLPYTVNFGGQKTSQMLLGSDGKLQFVDNSLSVIREVDTGIGNGPTIYVDGDGNVVDPEDDPFASPIPLVQLASIGGPHYLAMQSFSLDEDPLPDFLHPVADYVLTDGVIKVSWFTCYNPNSRCFSDVHSVTLTPDADGFAVVYGGINDGKPGERLQATFERSTAMPEPATWVSLLVGFGSVGAVLRRKRRSRLA